MMKDDLLYFVFLPVLAVAALLIAWRFFKGPRLSDRVVALDLLITTGIGIIAVYSILADRPTFLDIAMILALIAFLTTVAFSYYLEKREGDD